MSSTSNLISKMFYVKPGIRLALVILAFALYSGQVWLWVLLLGYSAYLAVSWSKGKFNPNYNLQEFSALGLDLKYNYKNVLGIDEAKGKIFICTDKPRSFDKHQIRSVEKESIHEVQYNAYGHGFHKDKKCKLIFHVADLNHPMHTVEFSKKEEMDIWYSRVSVFCNLN